jgi:hypothetical protein
LYARYCDWDPYASRPKKVKKRDRESPVGIFGTHGADGHGSAMRSTAEVDQPMFKGPSLMFRPAAVFVQFHNAAKVSKSNFPIPPTFQRECPPIVGFCDLVIGLQAPYFVTFAAKMPKVSGGMPD